MVHVLALLITIIVNRDVCQSPCTVNWLLHLERDNLKGRVCVKLINMSDFDDTRRSCWDVEPGDLKFKRDSFKGVGKGDYLLYATLDDVQVSNKPRILITGSISEEKFK